MRRGGVKRARKQGFAGVFARIGLWLTAFALLSQSLALAAPPMLSGNAREAAVELSAALGPSVVICTQDEAPAPGVPVDCHDQCPLCQVVANAAALDAPPTATLIPPLLGRASELAAPAQPRYIPRPRVAFSYSRGPPSKT